MDFIIAPTFKTTYNDTFLSDLRFISIMIHIFIVFLIFSSRKLLSNYAYVLLIHLFVLLNNMSIFLSSIKTNIRTINKKYNLFYDIQSEMYVNKN